MNEKREKKIKIRFLNSIFRSTIHSMLRVNKIMLPLYSWRDVKWEGGELSIFRVRLLPNLAGLIRCEKNPFFRLSEATALSSGWGANPSMGLCSQVFHNILHTNTRSSRMWTETTKRREISPWRQRSGYGFNANLHFWCWNVIITGVSFLENITTYFQPNRQTGSDPIPEQFYTALSEILGEHQASMVYMDSVCSCFIKSGKMEIFILKIFRIVAVSQQVLWGRQNEYLITDSTRLWNSFKTERCTKWKHCWIDTLSRYEIPDINERISPCVCVISGFLSNFFH